jgi:ribosomal protein L37E
MSNADWWAAKLAAVNPTPPSTPREANMPSMPPSQQPMATMPPIASPSSERAQSANQTALCPECGSSNYLSVQNAATRCFDCGYPLEQSGSKYGSLTGARVEGSAKGAVGNDVTSNWNPQGIIGRIN